MTQKTKMQTSHSNKSNKDSKPYLRKQLKL